MKAAEFAAVMAQFGPPPARVAVAVSGGPHSLALALLAKGWSADLGVALFGLVVEHGLRHDSAAEAEHVGAMLLRQGIHVRVMKLALPSGAGVQARAREARLMALMAACRDVGAPWLLLGHHRMDQAETLILRAGRGIGMSGLAAMPGLRAMPAAVLLRPLLDTPPAALEEVCAAAGLAPVRDPSNHNPAFARIRVRRALADSGDVGVAMTALAGATHAFAARRERLEAALLLRLAESVLPLPCGAARIDRTLLGDDAVASALLGRLLRVVGAAEHAPPQSEVARLLKAGSGTLGGAWWRRDGWLLREPALLAPPIPAASGALWDGRFHLAESAPGCLLGALGPGHGVGSTLPAAVRAGLPALWADGRVVMAPHIGVGKPLPGLVFRPVGGPVGSLFAAFPHLGHSPGGNVTYVM